MVVYTRPVNLLVEVALVWGGSGSSSIPAASRKTYPKRVGVFRECSSWRTPPPRALWRLTNPPVSPVFIAFSHTRWNLVIGLPVCSFICVYG